LLRLGLEGVDVRGERRVDEQDAAAGLVEQVRELLAQPRKASR